MLLRAPTKQSDANSREIAFKISSPPGIPAPVSGMVGAGANVPGLGGPSGVGQIKDIGLFILMKRGERTSYKLHA